jgi:hypothetical protein
MKKLLIILGVLVLLVVVGVGIFIATFDADRYRPQLVQGMQQALGRPVTLDRVKLAWRGGIAVELHGLAIPEPGAAEPLVRVERISALVRLGPLMQKDVQVASLVFTKPAIHVMRDAQGRINLMGLAPVAGPAAPQPGASPQPAPGTASQGAGTRPTGTSADAVAFRVDALEIKQGSLHWTDAMTRPATELWLRQVDARVTDIAPGQPITLELSAALNAEAKNLRVGGRVTPPGSGTDGSVQQLVVALERAQIESLLPPPATPTTPHARGLVTVNVSGDLPSLDPVQLQRAATVNGTVKLDDVVLVNVNVLKEVFSRLSILPGLVQRLQERLPKNYQAKLEARDTPLAPTEIPIQVSGGTIRCERLEIATDTFKLTGAATVSPDQVVQGQARLAVEAALSDAIIRSINELQALADAQGSLEMPLALQGRLPNVAVLPDLNYVASRVVTRKAADFIGDLLAPKDEAPADGAPGQGGAAPTDGNAAPGTAAPATTAPDEGDILQQLLQRALERPRPSDPPAQ